MVAREVWTPGLEKDEGIPTLGHGPQFQGQRSQLQIMGVHKTTGLLARGLEGLQIIPSQDSGYSLRVR